MYSILICDDEKDIVNAIRIYLSAENYEVYCAYNGREAVDIVRENTIHLVLLDIMMPEMGGLQALTEIRKFSNVPVVFLTAKTEDTDKVLGLSVGADDYITKPFNPVELLARVKSQLRRYMQLGSGLPSEQEKNPDLLQVGGIEMDDSAKQVTIDGEPVALTKTEYDLLKFFMQHPGKVFPPAEIYRRVWQDDPYGSENTVAVHIRHLREKIEIDPSHPRYLQVVWGHGYCLKEG